MHKTELTEKTLVHIISHMTKKSPFSDILFSFAQLQLQQDLEYKLFRLHWSSPSKSSKDCIESNFSPHHCLHLLIFQLQHIQGMFGWVLWCLFNIVHNMKMLTLACAFHFLALLKGHFSNTQFIWFRSLQKLVTF